MRAAPLNIFLRLKQFHIVVIAAALALVLGGGCDFFSTREPEEPDTGRSSFQPPTSPEAVVANFVDAVAEVSTENYLSCLAGASQSADFDYYFLPSAETSARYQLIFESWDAGSERQAFISLEASLGPGERPVLKLTVPTYVFDVRQIDSVLYVSDYYLEIPFVAETIPTRFSGTLQLTVRASKNGNWSVHRWVDIKKSNDTIAVTWSDMKALFYNK